MPKAAAKKLPEKKSAEQKQNKFRMFLIPCSCGASFAVSEDYDRKGMHIRSFIPCPNCGKRHDPRNRLLQLDYQQENFWKVGGC
jgi:hydrogenase maturation factor HypF (carbamoyltransferase family)